MANGWPINLDQSWSANQVDEKPAASDRSRTHLTRLHPRYAASIAPAILLETHEILRVVEHRHCCSVLVEVALHSDDGIYKAMVKTGFGATRDRNL